MSVDLRAMPTSDLVFDCVLVAVTITGSSHRSVGVLRV
jgi:hypothetical protein